MRALAAGLVVLAATSIISVVQPRTHAVAFAGNALACGVERWPAKTLADPGSRFVRLHPRKSSVRTLVLADKAVGLAGVRGLGVEQRTYRLRVRLVEVAQEADGDFHLVIADAKSGATMIAEFPAKQCTHGALRGTRAKMERARVAFVRACGFAPNGSFRHLSGTATIVGVGFFDFLHRQRGHAPNGVELHPVLRFNGRCR
jgi:hypothetical protein